MKKLLLFAAMLAAAPLCKAQDDLKVSFNTDLVSSYVWRGQVLDNVSLQPTLNLLYKGFELEGWASVGLQPLAQGAGLFHNSANEVDIMLGYNFKGFKAAVYDYFCAPFATTNFFKFDEVHTVAVNLAYDFDFLSVNAYMYVCGDLQRLESGKKDFSPYAEISAPFTLGGLECQATVGASFMESWTYNTEHFDVVDMNLVFAKDIELGCFSLPASVQVGFNPREENGYLVFGLHF